MSKILIIDCQGIGYQAHFALGGMEAYNTKTHVIFGFLQYVLRLSKRFNTRNFIFCWDSRNNKRVKMYPSYKEKRHELTQAERKERKLIFKQFAQLRTIVLPALGFKNIYIKPGYEADDLIASFCDIIGDPSRSIVVSEDGDMLQLLDLADIFKNRSKKIYKRNHFIKEYGIEPDLWAEVKAIEGCSSDEVEGIVGVGTTTAIKFLKDELKKTSVKYKSIICKEGQAIIERNRGLVTLPINEIKLRPLKEENFLRDNFIDVFENYSFKSFLKDEEFAKWSNLFQLR